jgi:hypothetical protein
MKESHVAFALDFEGNLTDIKNVSRGLDCKCKCLVCGDLLIAKKGQEVEHHFAHKNIKNCSISAESALHLAAKRIFKQNKKLLLPDCHVTAHLPKHRNYPFKFHTENPLDGYKDINHFDENWPGTGVAYLKGKFIEFDWVELEETRGSIRPDAIGYFKGKELLIEFAVTHFIDEEKLTKLQTQTTPCIEVDLRHLLGGHSNLERVAQALEENRSHKLWIVNRVAQEKSVENLKLQPNRIAQHNAEKEKKRVAIEKKYGAKYEIKFKTKINVWVTIRLSSSQITVRLWPKEALRQKDSLMEKFEQVNKLYSGTYNDQYNKWEYSPNLEKFYSLIKLLYSGERFEHIAPPDNTKEFLERINEINLERTKSNQEPVIQRHELKATSNMPSNSMSPAMAALAAARAAHAESQIINTGQSSPNSEAHISPAMAALAATRAAHAASQINDADQSATNSEAALSPAMAALAAARRASKKAYIDKNSDYIEKLDSPVPTVKEDMYERRTAVPYYSSIEDFLSLGGTEAIQWEQIDLEQRNQIESNENGFAYVKFDLQKYKQWLGKMVDTKAARRAWAQENIKFAIGISD